MYSFNNIRSITSPFLDYLEALADFKQRRLMSVGQLKKSRIKSYFDIRRKWLMAQHTKEMEARNRAQQESMKRLAMAQAIERQTACRLARTTAKGQRKVSLVLNSVNSDSSWDRDISKGTGSHSCALENRPISADTSLIDMIFTKTGHSTPDSISVSHGNKSISTGSARPSTYYDGVHRTVGASDTDDTEVRTTQSSRTLTANYERELGPTPSTLSTSSAKRQGPSGNIGRGNFKPGLRQAKSVTSIHSALDVSYSQPQK